MRLGETLIRSGVIDENALETALNEQKISSQRLGEILISQGISSAEKIAPGLADHFQLPHLNLKEVYKDIRPEIIDSVPVEMARRFNVIPVDVKDNTIVIATFDPLNILAIDTIRIKTGMFVECVIASENEISTAIEYCYHNLLRMDTFIDHFVDLNESGEEVAEMLEDGQYEAGDQPVVEYVKSLIVHAVNSAASDVLLQPKQDSAELRFRIDGVLYNIDPPPKVMLPAITTRIKILAGMDIAERRLPQDGRFKVTLGRTAVDIRTSTFPTIYGESVVMRLLDISQPLLGIDQLGFDPRDLERFKSLLRHSYGLVLVTGPTGSGKTTTLYTALNEIKSAQKNIITLEDPVEYRLPFLQQSQVKPQIGFTFATGLRSILRQDPDIIMVGEIRDKETAEIAIHAALTGHLVFSTLHTNDAAGAAVRLINMGIEPFLISSSLLGVVAQRLIRRICPECREQYEVSEAKLIKMGLHTRGMKYYHGRGCPKCLDSGYKGRVGIYELLVPDTNVRRAILENSSSEKIKEFAQKAGMKSLRDLALEKLKEGFTTPEEIIRTTQETEDDSVCS